MDTSVYMRLCGEMNHNINPVSRYRLNKSGVTNITSHKTIPGMAFKFPEVFRVPGVSQLVEIDYGAIGVLLEIKTDKVTTYKP